MQKMPRLSTDDERAEIKAATRRALRAVKASSFALVTRVDAPSLSRYGSIALEAADHFMPIDVALDLQHEFGRGVASPILEALAALAGFRLVPLEGGDDGEGLSIADVQGMIKEGGEAKAAALAAVGSPCLQTVRAAHKETMESHQQSAVILRRLSNQERTLMRRAG